MVTWYTRFSIRLGRGENPGREVSQTASCKAEELRDGNEEEEQPSVGCILKNRAYLGRRCSHVVVGIPHGSDLDGECK